jgi:O-antigen ligase
MWLFIHRPFEVWPVWGELRIERLYMIFTLVYWLTMVPKRWPRNPLHAAFALFGLVLATAWLTSEYRELGAKTVEDWFKIIIFYVLVVTTVRGERELTQLIVMYLAVLGLYMAHSLWEYHCGRHQYTMGTVRMLGIDLTYGDPNTFAATIVYSLPLAIVVWPLCRRGWQSGLVVVDWPTFIHSLTQLCRRGLWQGLLVGYVVLSATCVLLTSSRSGFVGLCFLVGAAALLSKRRKTWILLLAVAAPLVWRCLPEDRQNRFLTLIDPSYGPANAQESAEGRAKGWHDGVRLCRANPTFGVGPGAFGTATGGGFESHHLYGQILGELGAMGALAFAAILASFAANGWATYRRCRQWPEHRGEMPVRVIWGTSLTVVLMLLLGFAGHNLYRYTWLWFGAFQVIALDCMKQQEHDVLRSEEEDEESEDSDTPSPEFAQP